MSRYPLWLAAAGLWAGAAMAQQDADPHAGHGAARGGQQQPTSGGSAEPPAMDHGAMQGGRAPADARDPHAYANGADFGPYKLHLMGEDHRILSVLVDRLEYARAGDDGETAYDVEGWYGTSYDRAVFKAEGEVDAGRLQAGRTELLWGHAIAPYWDAQVGVRHDSGIGADRGWLAVGVQGLAPYWFEVEATAYIADEGRAALRFDAEYELLFTQRLILQPRLEANWYRERDAVRGLGQGLANLAVGLRLRYEFRREVAPYIGIERIAAYGSTADIARAAGEDAKENRWVAGVRLWF